ncbi:MAG: winged helix-turn-helix transcriptional regulator [Deltaproteobacteria bacterium]|nr:winged helix-turn-helix transcriptional regulator [Deltaproteobacteria bacterium]
MGKVFLAIADPTRRKILDMLREGERSAGDLASVFQMSKPAVSHHLATLKAANLATERREGQRIIYSLVEGSLLETWDNFLARFCSHTLDNRKKQKEKRSARKRA